ncbi:MAG: glycosyltransferase [Lachnospiraceae bacterium]|nr:glycosyltransferase [Lachnospiraceae bacterium]
MKNQSEEKLISVIVAAYNIGEYLPRCLDSLLAQSYRKLEIIVVDDGSGDDTGAVCDRYAGEHERIKVIHQQRNEGPSGARNKGLAIAKGDYIGYVDGDDWVEPEMYAAMLRACEEQECDIAVCAYREIGAENTKKRFSEEQYVLTQKEALEIYICDNRQFHIYHSVWSKLFKRSVIEKLEFPAGRKSEDIIYTTKALLNISSCVFLDTPYYNYRVNRKGSIMNEQVRERRFRDEIPFWREQIECLRQSGFSELSEKAAYYFYRRLLFYYVDFRDRKMKAAGAELAGILGREKDEIKRIYQKNFVTLGDRMRMKLVMFWPGGYYRAVKVYDNIIMPLRLR